MKTKKQRAAPPVAAAKEIAPPRVWKLWHALVLLAAALLVTFEVYGPALRGEFLFDDIYLPFLDANQQDRPLREWLGVRPLLMTTYWLNFQQSGLDPLPYHVAGVLLHIVNALLAGLIVRRMLSYVQTIEPRRRDILALVTGGIFLLHPVQTESVAYVAGRSETFSVLFFLAAYAVFLYRGGPGITTARAAAVLVLYGLAITSKEHTIVLPGLLLLTDLYFNRGGLKQNWRLYAPLAAGALAGIALVWRVLSSADSAGFKLQGLNWYEYLFSQFRLIWVYLKLYVFPFGQNGDYDAPVSRTIFDHGAVFGLIGLLALAFAAWRYRKQFPLASFGFFGFLLLLAPTSSIVPIKDLIAERRLYLPFVCLLLITADMLWRWRATQAMLAGAGAAALTILALLTYQRNHVWAGPVPFWSDVVAKSPNNARAHFQLAYAYWQSGRCEDAVHHYSRVAALQKPDVRLLVDWAYAYDCLQRPGDALAKLREAAKLENTGHVNASIGMILGKSGRAEEALRALDAAEKADPNFDMTYVYRGNVLVGRGDFSGAAREYRRALAINPRNEGAVQGLRVTTSKGVR